MNVYGLMLFTVLTFVAVEARPDRHTYAGGVTWYCMYWGIGCAEDHPCIPILLQKDTGTVFISDDAAPSAYAIEMCEKWGLGCCKSDDEPDVPVFGTRCDKLARAANAVYVYMPHMSGVIRKEMRKLEKQLGVSFSDKEALKDAACDVADAKNLSELAKALNTSKRQLLKKHRRLQRRAEYSCKRFTAGMGLLYGVDSRNVFTKQAYYALKHFCGLLSEFGIFSMAA